MEAKPYKTEFVRNFVPGTTVSVEGEVTQNPDRFILELAQDESNIMCHFNPRFIYKKEPYVVFNVQTNGKWGTEECKFGDFPFAPGKKFQIDIECQDDYFHVTVDGKFFSKFENRWKTLKNIRFFSSFRDCNIYSVVASPLG